MKFIALKCMQGLAAWLVLLLCGAIDIIIFLIKLYDMS